MTRRITIEAQVSRVLKDAAAERKAKALDSSVTEAVSEVMREHGRGGDQEQVLRILVRKGAEQISKVVGPLEASTFLAKLAGQLAPAQTVTPSSVKAQAEAAFPTLKRVGVK